jgi:hypothetical protein
VKIKGIAGGVAGLVVSPVKGAQKHGATGFVKGLAQGIIGVRIKF